MLLSFAAPLESYLKFNLAFDSLVLAYASISAWKGLATATFFLRNKRRPENHLDGKYHSFRLQGCKDMLAKATSQDIFMQIYLITLLGWHLLLQSYFQREFN